MVQNTHALDDKFKNELDSAREGSDLHWFIRKVAEEVSRKIPSNNDLENWNGAKGVLLFYCYVEICSSRLRREDSIQDYLTREFNQRAQDISQGNYGERYFIEAQDVMARRVVDLLSFPI
jgi:hypothetical protein